MKKRLYVSLLAFLLIIISGCSSRHTHNWSEANYQQPSTCSVCGATRGTVLTPDFQKYHIDTNLSLNTKKDLTVNTTNAEEKSVIHVELIDFQTIDYDSTHSGAAGYQWQIFTLTISVGDEASNKYGFIYNYIIADYYDSTRFESTYASNDNQNNKFTVNYKGTDYEDCICDVQVLSGEWTLNRSDNTYYKTITIIWNVLVPTGYDGIVVGIHDGTVKTEGKYFFEYYSPEHFLLFRGVK